MKSKITLQINPTTTFEDLPEIKDVNGNYGESQYVIAFSKDAFYKAKVIHIYAMDKYMDEDDKYNNWLEWENERGDNLWADIIAWAELPNPFN